MRIVFWQNSISIHQVPFIKALARDYEVYLFVEKKISQSRLEQGWEIPDTDGINVEIINESNYSELVSANKDAYHFFSGVNVYPIVSKALKNATKFKLFVAIIAEPQNWLGIRGVLNRVRSMFYFARYGKKINLMLTIGSRGKSWYVGCGYPSNKIYEWGYFVEKPEYITKRISSIEQNVLPNLLFVGRLVKMKGIYELIEVLKYHFSDKFNKLTIVGTGIEFENLQNFVSRIKLDNKVIFKGKCAYKDVWAEYLNADYLILPSLKKEGWGAVINESLLSGVPVIASDYCGASMLINSTNGYVFNAKSKRSFIKTLDRALNNKSLYALENKILIQENTEELLSIDVFVSYFISIISALTDEIKPYVKSPWIL